MRYSLILLFAITGLLIACKEDPGLVRDLPAAEPDVIQNQTSEPSAWIPRFAADTIPEVWNTGDRAHVGAHYGISLHDAPQGTRTGRYNHNATVEVIETTQIVDTVYIGEQTFPTRWLKVQGGQKVHYVLDHYLTKEYTGYQEFIAGYAVGDSVYVTAASGLRYRDAPQGTVAGKFRFNQQLRVVEVSNVTETLKDGDRQIPGRWILVQAGADQGYVFSGFTGATRVPSLNAPTSIKDLDIFYLGGVFEAEEGRTMVTLTDSYPYSANVDSLVIDDRYKDNSLSERELVHTLSRKRKNIFLDRIGYTDNHELYVYDYEKNKMASAPVASLDLIAHINPYGASDPMEDYDFMIGFDITDQPEFAQFTSDATYVWASVATSNPFSSAGMQPLDWQPRNWSSMPVTVERINENLGAFLIEESKIMHARSEGLDYYVLDGLHLVATPQDTWDPVLHVTLYEGESASRAGLNDLSKTEHSISQWAGKLFKDYPPVTFGYLYESFGCEAIYITGNPQRSVYVKCDNRH